MGCFLGCFGFTTSKQKRIKNCNKFQVHQKYVQLDSEKANAADSEPRDKPKESSGHKVKKKVSFNLNVQAYERIQDNDNATYFSDEEEKTKWEYDEQEKVKASLSMYPSSYRYYNCNEEEDEIELEESDIDDLDEEEDYGFSDEDDYDDGGDEKENEFGNDKSLNRNESNEVDQDHRNMYGNSVLLPVENLTQWKAVKARGGGQVKQQKENVIKPEISSITKPVIDCVDPNPKVFSETKPKRYEMPVVASLSNWVVSAGAASVNSSAVCYIEDRAEDHQLVLSKASTI